MKLIKAILTVAVIVSTVVAHTQETNKDEMVKKIFAAFKNQDQEAFVRLFPDAATVRDFIIKTMDAGTALTPEMKAQMDEVLKRMTDSSLHAEYRRDFERFLEKGQRKGVDWSKASLASFSADSLLQQDDGQSIVMLSGKIYFNSNEKEYFMAYNEVIWLDDKGWYGVNIGRVAEKSQENQSDEVDAPDQDEELPRVAQAVDNKVADSLVMIIDSLPTRGEVKKPVQKPKAKEPVKSSAKPRTQSPAKKPE